MPRKAPWTRMAVGDLLTGVIDYRGKTPPKADSGIPCISAANVKGGVVTLKDKFVSQEVYEQWTTRGFVRPGDVLITTEAPVAEVAILPSDQTYLITRRVMALQVNDTEADNKFLMYSLLLEENKKQLEGLSHGATVPRLFKEDILGFELRVPPLPTQKKISAILSAYDDLIANNLRRLEILDDMAQNLYREWFVKFRFPGHQDTRFVDSPLGRIPEGWEAVRFSDILESGLGGDWGVDEPNAEKNSPVLVIRGTDFSDILNGACLRTPRRFITPASQKKRQLRVGDLLVENSVNAKSRCVGTTLLITDGVQHRLKDPAIAASFCKVYRFKNPALAPLAHHYMRYLYAEGKMAFYQNVAANGIGNFQSRRFLQSEHLVVPAGRRYHWEMLLNDLTSSTLADQTFVLRRTRDLLLPKLISGEVDVSELDIQAPEEVPA